MSSTLPKIKLSGGDNNNNKPQFQESDPSKLNNTSQNFNNKKPNDLQGTQNASFLQNIGASIINSGTKNNINSNLSSKVPNLKLAIEQLDLIPENEEKEDENKINNTNLFKNLKNFKVDSNKINEVNDPKENKLEVINSFNNTIMSSKNWGENNLKNGSNKDPMERTSYFKPSKKFTEREMGRSIMDTKLPRARLPNRFMEHQIVSKSTAVKKNEKNE